MKPQHGGNLYQLSKKYNIALGEIVDFSANINPLCFPDGVKRILKEDFNKIRMYPDPDCSQLTDVISDKYNIKKTCLIPSNGATELIYLICYLLRPKKAAIIIPAFSEYEKALSNIGCNIKFVRLKEKEGFKLKLQDIRSIIKSVEVLFICNPNNPTGQKISPNTLYNILHLAKRHNVFVVIDEAFIDLIEEESLVAKAQRQQNLFVIRSLTKFLGIPGLRLGFGVASARLSAKIKNFQPTWSVNTFAQIAGSYLLADSAYIEKSKKILIKERNFLVSELKSIKSIKVFDSCTNFILFKLMGQACLTPTTNNPVGDGHARPVLEDLLISEKIAVRNCSNFRGLDSSFVRVAVKKRDENKLLIKALRNIFG
ncbi:threonine-phosphate decarboxylase [bacterium]|nr:threonine-phosphate decarboxylase [bacterium]